MLITMYFMDILEKMTGNVSENTACWNAVESAIKSHGVDVPEGTPKSEYAEKVNAVYEAGKKSEYDAFWDAYLPNDNGNMTSVFAGNTWCRPVGGVVAFKPNKDIKPVNATNMFYLWNNGHKVNLKEYLDGLGVKLDFSNCTDMTNCFNTNTTITALGVIDARKATRMNSCFYWMTYLESIEEFMPPTDKTAWTNQVFQNCDRLQHIVVNGEFVTNGWNFQWSTLLSHDSIVSIINALSPTTSGLTVTLSKTAVNNAFATATGAADGTTSQEWADLIATKSNWTISLV